MLPYKKSGNEMSSIPEHEYNCSTVKDKPQEPNINWQKSIVKDPSEWNSAKQQHSCAMTEPTDTAGCAVPAAVTKPRWLFSCACTTSLCAICPASEQKELSPKSQQGFLASRRKRIFPKSRVQNKWSPPKSVRHTPKLQNILQSYLCLCTCLLVYSNWNAFQLLREKIVHVSLLLHNVCNLCVSQWPVLFLTLRTSAF